MTRWPWLRFVSNLVTLAATVIKATSRVHVHHKMCFFCDWFCSSVSKPSTNGVLFALLWTRADLSDSVLSFIVRATCATFSKLLSCHYAHNGVVLSQAELFGFWLVWCTNGHWGWIWPEYLSLSLKDVFYKFLGNQRAERDRTWLVSDAPKHERYAALYYWNAWDN